MFIPKMQPFLFKDSAKFRGNKGKEYLFSRKTKKYCKLDFSIHHIKH